MRIYSDQALNVLYIEGVSSGPVADYTFSNQGDFVSAYRLSLQTYDIAGLSYQSIQDGAGHNFDSVASCMAYLQSLTIPSFPLHFTTRYPMILDQDVVAIDETFLDNFVYLIDGQNF